MYDTNSNVYDADAENNYNSNAENNSNSNADADKIFETKSKEYDNEMLAGYDETGLLAQAETIIQQSNAGNITIKEKKILDKSLEILTNIYMETGRAVGVTHSTPGQMHPSIPLSAGDAEHIIFLKNMELKYLFNWINIKRFLTHDKDLEGVKGHPLKGWKGIKSRKGRRRFREQVHRWGRKRRKSIKGRKV